MSYKRILMSVSVIAFVGVLVVGATGAFFSDTETSTGNTFTAGAIDLKIDNDSYLVQNGEITKRDDLSWDLSDLDDGQGPSNDRGDYLFFNYQDLKPGDLGEDTISIHVDNNDAWLCGDVEMTKNDDVSTTEPESDVDDEENTADDFDGELAQNLNFAFWADDGDNVFEDDEQLIPVLGREGNRIAALSSILEATGNGTQGVLKLADSEYNFFADQPGPDSPLAGRETHYLGKAWCFGEMDQTPADQDGAGDTNPESRGETGFTCSGENLGNDTQTDVVEGNVSFRAVQSRNNGDFVCEVPEEGDREPVTFQLLDNDTDSPGLDENKEDEEVPGAEDEDQPWIDWEINGDEIEFTFHNPTPWVYVFDVRVDGESGSTRIPGGPDITTDTISEGPLATQKFGQTYRRVEVDGSSGTHQVTQTYSGNSEIQVGLREGAEQKTYIDWITFEAN